MGHLLVHSEVMQRREQQRREAAEAAEAMLVGALRELPIRAWRGDALSTVRAGGTAVGGGGAPAKDDAGGGGSSACSSPDAAAAAAPGAAAQTSASAAAADVECCLCMESLCEGEAVRLLPCEHFFHAACIDRWFDARKYQKRTCPLCKRDPLDGKDLKLPTIPPPAGAELSAAAAATNSSHAAAAGDEAGVELGALPRVPMGGADEEAVAR